ncbi:uncharacterized protein EV420DRAFT_1481952 [Desarmillaria tabescens]|uniref:Uncharacterized protein n=1 Tax=Armillaria tabescens TaxID=1929756 RepID=A0AA39N0R8_ARMTA|nr:uncharacterized protein EV420DRAFT_1481952 [Desarmillaria tabescens]KAK0452960.1 hypothetical protein EV420DRAFT_1481952 [Desarmillaria tabescens]
MKWFALVLVSVSSVAAASISSRAAVAAVTDATTNQQWANIGMTYCTETGYAGICTHATIGAGTCITFGSGDTFYQTISSVRNDPENTCTIFSGLKCTGASMAIDEGYSDLSTVGWDNTAVSYICDRNFS